MWNHVVVIITTLVSIASAQNDNSCECVPFYLCTNGIINVNGADIFDIRVGGGGACNCNCTDFLFVCCRHLSNKDKNPVANTSSSCGYRKPDGYSLRISKNEDDTEFGEFPWMMKIFEDGNHQCGGSLIHSSVVLTAAHCVNQNDSTYIVRAGEWDSSKTNKVRKHQDRNVSSINIHDKFNPRNLQNDIALVILEKPFVLAQHIQPACLVPAGVEVTNTRCYATGWGTRQRGPNQNMTDILKKVDLPMVDKATCQEQLRKTIVGRFFELHESFVCAGGEKDRDTCKGDGGGPLVCPIEGQEERYQQVGITSWGVECNRENRPGVYVNVALFRKWIDGEMTRNGFGTSFYKF